jgi:hypothetical protein
MTQAAATLLGHVSAVKAVRGKFGSGLLSFLFCEGGEPVCQKHRNCADPHSKNEQCGNEEVTTVAATAHLPPITEAALSKVEGCPSWFLGRLVTPLFPHSPHSAPEGN